MKKVIAKFAPVKNAYWYDIREVILTKRREIKTQVIKWKNYKSKLDYLLMVRGI